MNGWRRWVLYFAGVWNIAGGLSGLAADPPAEPVQAFFFRATWINVTAWGIGYALAAHFSQSRLPILIAGAVGKLAYFGACWALYASGSGSMILFAAGGVDVIFAAVFIYIVWSRGEAA